MALDHERKINKERAIQPRLMDSKVFASVGKLITHKAIEYLRKEWSEAERWMEEINNGEANTAFVTPTEENGCQLGCDIFIQFQLPCKCWLFLCIELRLPIPLSLIHPRWLLDGPDYVVGWKMSLSTNAIPEQASEPASIFDPSQALIGDRYRDQGVHLVENAAINALEYQKTLSSDRAEAYAKGLESRVTNYSRKFAEKEASRAHLPLTFTDPLETSKALTYSNKNKRALTGREAADYHEKKKIRMERTKAKEANNLAKDDEAEDLRTIQESEAFALSLQDQDLSPIETTFNAQGIDTVDMTQQSESLCTSSQLDLQLRSNSQVATPPSFASDIGCENLDQMSSPRALFDYEEIPPADNLMESFTEVFPTPPFVPELYSLSQKPTPSQLPSAVSLPSTRASRVVRLKSKAQLELESQERFEAGRKMLKAEKKKKQGHVSKEKKLLRLKEKRLEDVSQITDTISLLSSSDHEVVEE